MCTLSLKILELFCVFFERFSGFCKLRITGKGTSRHGGLTALPKDTAILILFTKVANKWNSLETSRLGKCGKTFL